MAKKRKRVSDLSKGSSKRVKSAPDLNLLDLPPEVINLILENVIDIPNQHHYATGAPKKIRNALNVPVMHTCRALRQLSLDLIQSNCLWIRIDINSRKGVEVFKQETAPFLPTVPVDIWSCFRSPSTILEMKLGDTIIPGAELRATRRFNHSNTSFMFPYNFDSFNRVCQWIRRAAVQLCLSSLLVRYDSQVNLHRRLLVSRILPTILTIRKLKAVKFEIPDDLKPSDRVFGQMLDTPRRASDLLKDAQTALRVADEYKAEGQLAEAGLKLLYSLWIYLQANRYLPAPEYWSHGENEEDPLVYGNFWQDSELPPARNAIGNRLRQSVHEIEYRACLAYRDLFEKFGYRWLLDHGLIFGIEHGRWVDEPHFTWFGLSSFELAQVHHARAVVQRIEITFEEVLTRPGHSNWTRNVWIDDSLNNPVYYDDPYETMCEEMYFATWLQPGNSEFKTLYGEMMAPQEGEELDDFEEMMESLKYGTEDLEGSTSWKGSEEMLYGWGGPEILQYLPMARKGLQ